MNLYIYIGCVLAVAVSCNGEACHTESQCHHTSCSDGNPPDCIHQECTCTVACNATSNLVPCKTKDDCILNYIGTKIDCRCDRTSSLHCFDGDCHCGYLSAIIG